MRMHVHIPGSCSVAPRVFTWAATEHECGTSVREGSADDVGVVSDPVDVRGGGKNSTNVQIENSLRRSQKILCRGVRHFFDFPVEPEVYKASSAQPSHWPTRRHVCPCVLASVWRKTKHVVTKWRSAMAASI